MKTGADISHHQATFDADRYYTSGEDFLIHKATEATDFVDDRFAARWRACGSRPRVAYHFARPGVRGPVDQQADDFIAVVQVAGWRAGDAWALDLETNDGNLGPTQLVAWADRWCARVRAALPNRGMFYTYNRFVIETMGNPGRIPGDCLGWIARYRTDTPYAPIPGIPNAQPIGWPDPPHVWQCSNGEVGCIKDVASIGRCDYNRMTDEAFNILFTGGEPDMTPEEHDALMALDNKIVEMAEQACRRTVFAVMTGGLGMWSNPNRPGWEFYNDAVQASATEHLAEQHIALSTEHSALSAEHGALGDEHDAHTGILLKLDPATLVPAIVEGVLDGLVAQGVVIPADIDHDILVADMKVALTSMVQKFEPISFDG